MIKKMTSLAVPVDQVQEVFKEIEAWPQWMPAIRRARVLEKTETIVQVELKSVMLGMEFDQTVEFRLQTGGFSQKQIAGRFKKWEAEWRFFPSPDGNGTTLSVTLDIDFGILGVFVPQRTIANAVNKWFSQLAQKAEERTKQRLLQRQPVPSAVGPAPGGAAAEIVLQVYQTAEGLEVWIGQQRFFIPASP